MSTDAKALSGPVLGFDVGGTKVAALVVDAADRILARQVAATPATALPQELLRLGRETMARAGLTDVVLAGVGIGAPGSVDSRTGSVRFAVNLDPGDVPLGAFLADALDAPVFVDHDARAAARYLATLEPGCRGVGYVSVGTGVAAGIVLDGEPFRGATGLSGEIGHLVADPGGPTCGCGLTGCVEAVASGPAIARRARAAAAGSTRSRSSLRSDATSTDVYAAAAAGDPLALSIADDVARVLARAIRGLVLSFGLDRVVVGGGVSRAGAAFFDPIQRALDEERARSVLVREAVGPDVVRLLPPEVDAGARGAVAVARAGIRAGGPRGAPERKEGG